MIENHMPGSMVLYLPPYSYDMNLIELAFSKVKAWPGRHGTEPEYSSDPYFALASALESVNGDDACGCMNRCGFPCFDVLGTGKRATAAFLLVGRADTGSGV